MDGTWKGSFSFPMMGFREFLQTFFKMTDEEWDEFDEMMDMEATFGSDMMVTIAIEVEWTIDSAVLSKEAKNITSMAFSGSKVTAAWETLCAMFSFLDVDDDDFVVDIDGTNHTITVTQINDSPFNEESIEETLASGYQINQYGTKIKVPADVFADMVGDNVESMPDVIFIKQ